MEFNIGPRMVKTGLAVTLTLLITSLLELDLNVIAVIASVLAMRPSIMRSFDYLKEVLLANSTAAIFSVLGTILLGTHPLSVGAVVIISIAVNVRLGMNKTVRLTTLTIVAMMLANEEGLNILYMIERVSLIGIGVLSAFLINMIVFPPNHQKLLYDIIKEAHEKSKFLLRVIPNKTMSVPHMREEDEEIGSLIREASDYYDIIFDERNRIFIKNRMLFYRNIVIFKHMIYVLRKMHTLIQQLEKNLGEIEEGSTNQYYLIRKLVNEITTYSENIFLMHEDKIVLDRDLQKEAKTTMRLTINHLIAELQGSEYDKWNYLFPAANSLIELFNEMEKLERFVRNKEIKQKKEDAK